MARVDHARDIKDNANLIARAVCNAVIRTDADEIGAQSSRIADAGTANVEIGRWPMPAFSMPARPTRSSRWRARRATCPATSGWAAGTRWASR